MKKSDFRPGPPADVSAHPDAERWTLVFVRELRHAPDVVWRALTDPAQLRAWAPYDADRDLGAAGDATLTMADESAERSATTVRRAEPPRLLEHTWGEDVLRWELDATAAGTRLTLRHTMGDKGWLPKVAAGWQLCVDVLERALAGDPVGRITGAEAKQHGWDSVNAHYARVLDIPDTGWPEGR